jgi:dTDP-4-amino-4,6-dideoxygalactose transaminase
MNNDKKIPLVDLKGQYESIKYEINEKIQEVLDSAQFVGFKTNLFIKEFERSFSEYIGVKHCISCGNGTDAIEIILRALGFGEGDEVIVPANSFIATSEAVTHAGATPVFVDCHPDYYTIDPEKIKNAVTRKTKALMPVHLYGLPAEMDEILKIANEYELKVIEDCAQAHGASYKNIKVGTFGNASAFSFYPGKNLGAYGDAGCMVTNDDALAERLRMWVNHGRTGKYDHEFEGKNSRMDALQAAILSVKLKHINKWNESRNNVAKQYFQNLKNTKFVVPSIPDYSYHAFHQFVVRCDNREILQEELKKNNIETGVHYPIPLPFLKAYEKYNLSKSDYPVSNDYMNKLLSLPMYPEISYESVDFICQILKDSSNENSLV